MNHHSHYSVQSIDTLKDLVDLGADKYAERLLFQFEENKRQICISYSDFRDSVEQVGAYFINEGFDGSHIALFSENSYAWILTHLAVVCSRNVIVPIDKELSADEARTLLHESNCSALVYSQTYADIAQELSEPGLHLYSMSDLPQMAEVGMRLLAHSRQQYVRVPQGDDLASIVFTSGTTGQSKGVMLTHRNFASDTYGAACNVCLEGMSLLVLPLHHTFGLVAGVFFEMIRGNTIYINRSLKRLATDLKKCSPQHIMAVPLIADTLCKSIWTKAKSQNKDRLLQGLVAVSNVLRHLGIDLRKQLFKSVHEAFGGRLECIISGGAPIESNTIKTLDDFGIAVLNGYGITECAPIVSVNMTNFSVPGSVGIPLVCNQVRIADDGEVLVNGTNVMQGYYHNEEATQEAFDGAWFRTGDLGRIDEQGALHIVGRKKNLIILSNGENISAEELESKLLTIPYVLEAIVRGSNDVITAELYLDPEQTDAREKIHEDIQSLNKRLAQNKNIANWTLRTEPFPKTSTKKIKR